MTLLLIIAIFFASLLFMIAVANRETLPVGFRNPGPFGETNRPGFPQPWRVAAKFASGSCALAPLSAMIHPTRNQPANVYPLSMLADCIVSNYYPQDTIVLAMSHPSSFCVGHQDIVSCIIFFFHITYKCIMTFAFCFNFRIISFVNSPLEEFHPIAYFFIITAWKFLEIP